MTPRARASALLAASLLLSARGARAEPTYARIAVGASGHVGYAFGDRCRAAVDDMVECPGGMALAGLYLMPRWRGGAAWSVGLRGGLAAHERDKSGPTDVWDAEAEVRWYPLGARTWELWLAATAGVAAAVDRVPSHTIDTGVHHPARAYTTAGPSAGLGVGLDAAVASFLAVGPELRAVVLGLDTGNTTASRPYYQPQLGVSLGLTVTALGDFSP
jgi:hypothetical protein